VADGGGLENRFGSNPNVGSNPTPSALRLIYAGVTWAEFPGQRFGQGYTLSS
jgi:hypothetical protein